MWPRSKRFRERYRVDDLIPRRNPRLLRAIFIGESPHRDEVAPRDPAARSPFRGVAGRYWWREVSRFLPEAPVVPPIPPRQELESWCDALGFALVNAVQYPLDPRITLHEGEACSPLTQLGFGKVTGPLSFRKSPKARAAIQDLARRLLPLSRCPGPVICLGSDARWFAERALALLPEEAVIRGASIETIPHPASWWRRPEYLARARATLTQVLG